jgi:hypothetical protein
MLGEVRVTHDAPECLRPRLLGAKATPFSVIAPAVALVARVVLGAHSFIFPASPMTCRRLEGFARVAQSEI